MSNDLLLKLVLICNENWEIFYKCAILWMVVKDKMASTIWQGNHNSNEKIGFLLKNLSFQLILTITWQTKIFYKDLEDIGAPGWLSCTSM